MTGLGKRTDFRRKRAWFLACAILFTGSLHSPAQTSFQRTFGGTNDDAGYAVQQTTDGGYVITGHSASFGSGGSDVYLIKTNAAGDALWTKTFGPPVSAEMGSSVEQTADGGYIICGIYFMGPGSENILLIKTNAAGDTLWTRTLGGLRDDTGWCARETNDGGYIVVGYTDSYGAGGGDAYLIKTDDTGNVLWQRTYGGIYTDEGYCVQQTADSGYIIVGRTYSYGNGGSDVYLIRTNATGGTLWTRTFGGGNLEFGWCVQQTRDGGFIIGGWTYSFGAGSADVYLINTDPAGMPLWERTFGGSLFDRSLSVQQTNDGGYIVVGETYSFGSGRSDVYLIKVNAGGETFWTRTFGGSDFDGGFSVRQTVDGGYVIAGCTRSFGFGQDDVYLIKTNVSGVVSTPPDVPTLRSFVLENNYPNPFNPSTTIGFEIPVSVFVSLKVYNVLGQDIAGLVNEVKQAGKHEVTWNASGQASGVYYCRLQADGFATTKKLILVR